MDMPPESSSLRAALENGRLSRAHVERFASELAACHARSKAPMGYRDEVGLILPNVFLHHGEMILGPIPAESKRPLGLDKPVVSDVAGVMLELEALGHRHLANFFLAAWVEQSGAFDALGTLRSCFPSDRAWTGAARSLVITHGLSGAGKTTVATALAGWIGAILIRNDVEVVRMKQANAELAPGALIDRIELLATQVVDAGWPVIVESCFLSRANRRRFRARAAELGVPFAILSCAAPIATVRERLERRRAFGSLFHGDDVGAERVEKALQEQLDRLDELDGDERAVTLTIDSSQPIDHQLLAARLGRSLGRDLE
jgi:uncharacterized protein